MKKLYVASSWRNPYQPSVVEIARRAGFDVYDFRNPKVGNHGFSWKSITLKSVKDWTFEEYREVLKSPIAEEGFQLDMAGLQADATILVMPAGRSAHFELGYATGQGQKTAVLYPVDVPMQPVSGHTLGKDCYACWTRHAPHDNDGEDCSEWHDERDLPPYDHECMLPTKLRADFEPELMIKGSDFLIGRQELCHWLASL